MAFTASTLTGRVGGLGLSVSALSDPLIQLGRILRPQGPPTQVRDRAGACSPRGPGCLVGVAAPGSVSVWKLGQAGAALALYCWCPCVDGRHPAAPSPQEPPLGPVTDPVTGSGPLPSLQEPSSSMSPSAPPPEQLGGWFPFQSGCPAHPPERGVCRPPRLPQGSRPDPQHLCCVPCGPHGLHPAELTEPSLGPAWGEPLRTHGCAPPVPAPMSVCGTL